jgi:cell division protein FtsL
MSDESFEWAIKKDVRNNPIVREVDRERHRDMWRSVGFSLIVVIVLVFTAWQQFELQQYGYQTEKTQKALAEEGVIRRRLKLEIESLQALGEVERTATTTLHMVTPGPDDSAVIERLVETSAPPKSVVAQR